MAPSSDGVTGRWLGFLGYAWRVLLTIVAHPVESADRMRGRLELLRERSSIPQQYEATPSWEKRVHEVIGADWPCTCSAELDHVMHAIDRDLVEAGTFPRLSAGHDADVAFARAAWILCRHLMPEKVVETGVARGVTSRVLLEALEANGRGRLWSIDLPPVMSGWHEHARAAVPPSSRSRWIFLRGASRRRLQRLLRALGDIDLFVNDTLHTTPTVRFEIATVWPTLREGGAILVDDVTLNAGFAEEAVRGISVIGAHDEGEGCFGVLVKPAPRSREPACLGERTS